MYSFTDDEINGNKIKKALNAWIVFLTFNWSIISANKISAAFIYEAKERKLGLASQK